MRPAYGFAYFSDFLLVFIGIGADTGSGAVSYRFPNENPPHCQTYNKPFYF